MKPLMLSTQDFSHYIVIYEAELSLTQNQKYGASIDNLTY